jgi:deferrochelatase/peroxidase EfeB
VASFPATRLPESALADIQGFIASGYGHLSYAAYLFLQFHDAVLAQRWLAAVGPNITSAKPWPTSASGEKLKPAVVLNIAFTADGLVALGLPPNVLCTFPVEFQEGIAQEERSHILGDTEESDPAAWELGGRGQPTIHAVVIVHALSAECSTITCGAQRALLAGMADGVVELPGSMQSGHRPEGGNEPFGFRDGIAQPAIAGISGEGIPTGEFILGYTNHFDLVPPTPCVPPELDADALLPPLDNPYHASQRWRDLGRNGSYVVYRKLQQDVAGFWQFMKRESRSHHRSRRCRPHDLAGVTVRRAVAERRPVDACAGCRRFPTRRPQRLPLSRGRRRFVVSDRSAHPPLQPSRRREAVPRGRVAQHVGSPSAAPSSAGLRSVPARSLGSGSCRVSRHR